MTPFWSMLILVILACLYYSLFLFNSRVIPLNSRGTSPEYFRRAVISFSVPVLILTAECIVYWFLRKKKIRKLLIRMHISLLYFALILLPILHVFVLFYLEKSMYMGLLFNIKFLVYWSCIIISHLFFIAVLINGFRPRKEQKPESDTSDILNEFTS
jgi:hypothetical protein